MSKIGKQPIIIPKGVEVKFDGVFIYIKGPKGEQKRPIDKSLTVETKENELVVKPVKESNSGKKVLALWGMTRSLAFNMVEGVTNGFEKNLTFEGVGYKANVKGDDLELSLGYSHPVAVKAPVGINFKVEKGVIKVFGIDKELVGHVAAEIKSKRLPEPYKGSGIKYEGEIITRKAGKKAATAA